MIEEDIDILKKIFSCDEITSIVVGKYNLDFKLNFSYVQIYDTSSLRSSDGIISLNFLQSMLYNKIDIDYNKDMICFYFECDENKKCLTINLNIDDNIMVIFANGDFYVM